MYISKDISNGTFRRNYEGDYHCAGLQIKTMLRDRSERIIDMEVVEEGIRIQKGQGNI